MALPSDLVDEAADLFYGGRVALSEMVQGQHEPYSDMATAAGTFFCQKVTSWNSDLLWVSVDDRAAFAKFEQLFQRMRLPEHFASVVPHRAVLRLYSAFFVVRSRCHAPSWHTDYWPPVGTDALTLITPLRDFDETDSFQLRYQSHQQPAARSGGGGEEAGASAAVASAAAPREERRYAYQKGRAIVFGSRFEHTTEVGSGRDGQVHAYLCFTFGTDEPQRWGEIARSLGRQSRVVGHPDGELHLSQLGEELEKALEDYRADQRREASQSVGE